MSRPRPRRRNQEGAISEIEWAFINDLPIDDIGKPWDVYNLEYDNPLPGCRTNRELWAAFGPVVLQRWVHEQPGTRPSMWWKFDAPRISHFDLTGREGVWEHPLPRRRLGGIGTPDYEVANYVPHFRYGLPAGWPANGGYYAIDAEGTMASGSAINGVPVSRAKVAFKPVVLIDRNDPPRFESQASYLDRLGLLVTGERKRLTPEDFEPELYLPEAEGDL